MSEPPPLLSFWAEAARNHADLPSVEYNGVALTYAELDRRADAFAAALAAHGVGPGDRVAIALERSPLVAAAVLGVLKAFAAYVPIDPRYPVERLLQMLRDAAPKVLLTQRSLLHHFSNPGTDVLLADELPAHTAAASHPAESGDEVPAYVIYTSGSSGQPKGVVLGRRALANLIAWQRAASRATRGWRTLQFTPLSFDVHFQEFFGTWATGGTLVIVDEETRVDPDRLLAALAEERIDRVFMPFVALNSLAELACRRYFPMQLKEVITAGEQLHVSPDLRAFFAALRDCTLHNHYGPSETHVVTAHTLEGMPDAWPLLPPIGTPLPGVALRVINESGSEVGDGESGELYVGGIALAEGYLHRPELTAERFVELGGGRYYRTGDLVRRNGGGSLEFLGRLDDQVKVRGHRVELGEIEAALHEHPAVKSCAVELRRERTPRLLAYWVARPGKECSTAALREYLSTRLPGHMIPARLLQLESLPRTPSGKVDRAALAQQHRHRVVRSEAGRAGAHLASPDEQRLAAIWARLLGVAPIDRHDNFFDLGGDSLLAARLMLEVEDAFGARVPIACLYYSPTLAQLADAVRNERATRKPRSLVMVQPGAGHVPLFYVPGATPGKTVLLGYSPYVTRLARALGRRRPIYSLFWEYSRGEESVETIAANLVADLKAVQPAGPYYLAGWSFGGLIAFEIARQLMACGDTVATLVLFDTAGPGTHWDESKPRLAATLRRWWRRLTTQADGISVPRPVALAGHLFGRIRSRLDLRPPDWSRSKAMERRYLPVPLSGGCRVTIFASHATLEEQGDAGLPRHEPDLGWGAVTAEYEVHAIPGDHESMFDEPGLSQIVRVLQPKLAVS